MTDHTGPEPTPTTAVPAAGGWDDAVRPTDQLLGEVSTGPIPAQRPDPDHPLPTHSQDTAGAHPPHGECEVWGTRRRVLRLLELGHTVSEAAEHLGAGSRADRPVGRRRRHRRPHRPARRRADRPRPLLRRGVVEVMGAGIGRRPYRWQTVAWAQGPVLTRGTVAGLPALTWGRAVRYPLATRRQLRTMGLRPGGQGPVAVLLFAHRQPNRRRVEHAWLYLTTTAAPKRTATPAQRAAIERALTARRTCRRCGWVWGYYLSTISRLCRGCEDSTDFWRTHATAHGWEWPT